MSAILKEDPPDLTQLDQKVPASLERLVRRCLEKDPEERFQSARDLGFALEAFGAGRPPCKLLHQLTQGNASRGKRS